MIEISDAIALVSQFPVAVVFGQGRLSEIGLQCRELGVRSALVVTDPGIVVTGYPEQARRCLADAGIDCVIFDGARENPTTAHIDAGVLLARSKNIDLVIGLGGGSAMDCAKGINLLLTNGGRIADYWGINKASNPLLPFVAVPTTAGTGSEAQSFALITDPVTHRKMACGDRRLPAEGGLRPRVAILDPDLIASVPRAVAAAAGIDAVAHSVETAGTRARTPDSRRLSAAAWRLLAPAFPRLIRGEANSDVQGAMLLGAHLAGAAIEQSMLGAAHASANPLTAKYGIRHGSAVGLMLPHVIRFNCTGGANPYSDLTNNGESLAATVEGFLLQAQLPTRLQQFGIPRDVLPELASLAAQEWTGQYNPREIDLPGFLELYKQAFA